MDCPQSGEVVRGGDARRGVYGAFPSLPTITPRRMLSAGEIVVAEASLDYDGPVYKTVFIFEFREGRIARETAYWSEPWPFEDGSGIGGGCERSPSGLARRSSSPSTAPNSR